MVKPVAMIPGVILMEITKVTCYRINMQPLYIKMLRKQTQFVPGFLVYTVYIQYFHNIHEEIHLSKLRG